MKPRVKTSGRPSSSCSTSSRSSTFLNTISPAPPARVGHQRPPAPAPNRTERARHTAIGTARTSPDRGVLRRHVLEPFLQVAVDDTLHQARQQARHGPAQGLPGCRAAHAIVQETEKTTADTGTIADRPQCTSLLSTRSENSYPSSLLDPVFFPLTTRCALLASSNGFHHGRAVCVFTTGMSACLEQFQNF